MVDERCAIAPTKLILPREGDYSERVAIGHFDENLVLAAGAGRHWRMKGAVVMLQRKLSRKDAVEEIRILGEPSPKDFGAYVSCF